MDRTVAVPVHAEPARLRLTRAWETTTVSETAFGRLLGLFVLLAIVASAAGLGHGAAEQTFLLIFSSIVIEALPFILVGALASAAIAVFLPERAFGAVARLPPPSRFQAPRWAGSPSRSASAARCRWRGV